MQLVALFFIIPHSEDFEKPSEDDADGADGDATRTRAADVVGIEPIIAPAGSIQQQAAPDITFTTGA